jgi:AcrR family transcriptional regulator
MQACSVVNANISDGMTETPYHHGNLRQALIDAALETLARDGAEAVTLRALARATGVSHAAPARHFPTRDALFAAIAEHGFAELTAAVTRARQEPADPMAHIRAMAMAHLNWAVANPALYRAMRNPEVMRHATPALRAAVADFARTQMEFVQRARATGWRSGETAGTTMMSVVAGLTGLATLLTDPFFADIVRDFGPGDRDRPLIDRLLAP